MIIIPLPDTNITRYIPQRDPVVMIDVLKQSDSVATFTSFVVKDACIFISSGRLQEPGLIENIAQTAAAGVGYQCALNEELVQPGFIAAIKSLKIDYLPLIGELLTTKVEVLEKVFDITLIKGEISVADKVIAVCEMKTVLMPK